MEGRSYHEFGKLMTTGWEWSTYRTHITNTLNALTGTEIEGSNTSANRSRPLPLLVVHSGKTTSGLLDAFLMVSSDFAPSNGSPFVDGVCPSEERTFHSDT